MPRRSASGPGARRRGVRRAGPGRDSRRLSARGGRKCFRRGRAGAPADRYGGVRGTFWTFVAMALGAGVVLEASGRHSLDLFPGRVGRALRPQRGGERLDVQDDPGDLPGQGAGGGCRGSACGRGRAALAEPGHGPDRSGRGDRRLRRSAGRPGLPSVLHPDGERAGGVRGVPRVLRSVPGGDLGLLSAPFGAPAAGRATSPDSSAVRAGAYWEKPHDWRTP
jgi:hypothetical protein